jgi:hypothetical protein
MGRRWRMVHGYTHSRNACESEQRGEMPLTRAIEAVYVSLDCKKRRVSRRKVREFLEQYCGCGAHHVAGPTSVELVNYYATLLTDDQKRQLLDTAKK